MSTGKFDRKKQIKTSSKIESKKKILFVIPSLVGGGAEKALIVLLKNLPKSKYNIHLCVVEKKGVYLDQVPDNVKQLHMFTCPISKRIVTELHRRFNISWPFKWMTRRTIKADYEVAISFLDSIYSDMLLFLKKQITKSVIVIQSSYKTYSNANKFIKGTYKKRLENRYKNIDTIVGVSQDAIDEFTEVLGNYDNLKVINNPINSEDINNKAQDFVPDFSSDVINIIAVGNLLPVKGYSTLIRACSLLKESGRNFQLRILGKGPLEELLKAQIQTSGLKEQISLLGFKSNPYPYIYQSDIFVMSSFAEGLPTALCEAIILGKPVVVTSCPGCREVVEQGRFGIMTESTPESLFEGLKTLVDDRDKRRWYAEQAKKCSEKFRLNHVINEYEKVLDH